MLESLPVAVIVGATLGYLAGLGVGGGSLLILWLTTAVDMPSDAARITNLLFFISSAGAVYLIRWKQGQFPIRKILPAVIAGCCAAVIFSWIGTQLNVNVFRKLFGVLLVFTGIREIFYRPRKER